MNTSLIKKSLPKYYIIGKNKNNFITPKLSKNKKLLIKSSKLYDKKFITITENNKDFRSSDGMKFLSIYFIILIILTN